jgi:uncharacterized membrane protein YoaK (UPF0700 family)
MFDRYGFVIGLIAGALIGIFTGSVAVWIGVGVVLGIAFSRRKRRREIKNTDIEILPPVSPRVRTR